MSYALGQMTNGVQVGSRAARDPILARASLAAAQVLFQAAKRPRTARPAFILYTVRRKYDLKTRMAYEAQLRAGADDQDVYDALRLAIADYYALIGLRYLQERLKVRYGDKFAPAALGDEAQDIGCAIGGGATAVLATIVGIFAGSGGASVVGGSGMMAMQAAGCGAEQQAAAQDLAEEQTRAAEATIEAARITADAEDARAARAAQQTKQFITMAAIGGGVLLLLGVGYVIVK